MSGPPALPPGPWLGVHPAWALHAVDADTVVALSEARRSVLRRPGLGRIVQAIQAGHTQPQPLLAACAHIGMPPDTVQDAVQALLARDYLRLCEAPPAQALPPAAHAPSDALLALPGIPPELMQACATALADAGIDLAAAGLTVVLCSDLRQPDLLALQHLDAHATQAKRPVLLYRPVGAQPSIGPLLGLPERACVHCLRQAVGSQRPMEVWLERRLNLPHVAAPAGRDPQREARAHAALAAAIAALGAPDAREQDPALARWCTQGGLLTPGLEDAAWQHHALRRRPQCPHCGDPDWMRRQAWTPPALDTTTSTGGLSHQAGGFRRATAEQTWARLHDRVSPLTGPLCYLHPMPGRHGGLRQVFVTGYMVPPDDAEDLGGAIETDKVCAGKGSTWEQARVSALCEGLERYSGVHQGDEARTRATAAQLGDAALPFDTLQHFSARQFAQRHQINARTRDARQQVPLPCGPDTAIDWTPAWSITQGRWRQVPLVYCYAQAPRESGRAHGLHNPNGCAAGGSVAEALLQGTLELIERDAVAIWWYNRLPRPAVDLTRLGDPWFGELQAAYADLGWQLWVLDLTHDLGIPVAAAVAWQADTDRHVLGFGCHVQPHLAVQRALTEANQLFDPTQNGPDPWNRSLLPEAPFLRPVTPASAGITSPGVRPAGLHGLPDVPPEQALAHCGAALARQGLEWLMVDKTRPDLGLNVVQAIVPGLRHFWPRFAPGRLYDVPVRLGWRNAALAEHELNPAPLFL